MARNRFNKEPAEDRVISIIGPGMSVVGDCKSSGSIRIEGVVDGTVQSDKAVVIGKDARVGGDVTSQEGVIAGTVSGTVRVGGRLEVHATGTIDGEMHADRLQLEEGSKVNGIVKVGRMEPAPSAAADRQEGPAGSKVAKGRGGEIRSPAAARPARASVAG